MDRGAEWHSYVRGAGWALGPYDGRFAIVGTRRWTTPIFVVDGNQLAQVLEGPAHLVLDAPEGSTVSVVALSDQVSEITYTGLEYPLNRFTLPIGSTRVG